MGESWLQVQVEVGREDVGRLEALLEAAGALVTWNEDAGDEPLLEPAPGSTPLWSRVRVTALLSATTPPALVADLIAGYRPDAQPRFTTVADRDWDGEWRRSLRPLRFGTRTWICPHGQACPEPAVAVVHLDPGLAFGTGTHPTTALCLEWLDARPPAGMRVLDYGCGSGVLALAAIALGAAHATAVDIDPQALQATAANAERNRCAERMALSTPDQLRAGSPFQVIVANILAGPLVRLAPVLRVHGAPRTRIALSGILADQAQAVAVAFRDWVELRVEARRDDWILLTGQLNG